jgi:photosystem II stability/assembly factor-like uncharacterized protein
MIKSLHVLFSALAGLSTLALSESEWWSDVAEAPTESGAVAPAASVHHPHDVCSVVALAPNYPEDKTVFTASWGSINLFLRSRNRGFGWRNLRSGMRGHRVADCALAPDWDKGQTLFVALEDAGLQRSVSGGEVWDDVLLHEMVTEVEVAEPSSLGRCVFAAGARSVYMSADNGDTWATIGATEHVVQALAIPREFAENPVVAIGTAGNEVLIRRGAEDWARTKLPAPVHALHFSPDFANDDVIWAGTYGAGLFRSADGGRSFRRVAALSPRQINDIAIAPAWPACKDLFVATPREGVHVTRDGGATFERAPLYVMETKQTENHYQTLRISPNYPEEPTIYLGAYEGLYCSRDGGDHWYEHNLNPTRIGRKVAISPDYPEDGHVFLSGYGNPIAVTTDKGQSWEFRSRGTKTMGAYSVAASPQFSKDQSIYLGTGRGVRFSRDVGANWTGLSLKPESPSIKIKTYEIRQMAFSPRFDVDKTMFAVSMGGYFVSEDAGASWTGKKIPVDWVWRVAVPPSWPEQRTVFIGGHSVWRSDDDGDSWRALAKTGKVLGLVCMPDFADTGHMLVVSRERGLLQSHDSGQTWQPSEDAFEGFSPTKVRLSPDYMDDGTVFVSTVAGGMFVSRDRAKTWERCAPLGGLGDSVFDFVVSPGFAQDQTMFACTFEGLVKSEDAGKSWVVATNQEIYDDARDPWIFRGLWKREGGAGLFGSGVHTARAPGRVANLAFTGTGIEVIGQCGPDKGRCEVLIDGESMGEFDCYSDTRSKDYSIFKVSGLKHGFHDMCLRVLGTRNEASSNSWITLDAAVVDYSFEDGDIPMLAKLENIYLTPGASYGRDTLSQNVEITDMRTMLRQQQTASAASPERPAATVASRLRALKTKDPEVRQALQDLLLKLDHLSNEMAAVNAQVESLDQTVSRKKK